MAKARKKPSLEQRLFQAYHRHTGMRLTPEDLTSLVHDDAVATRITNQACTEAGEPELGGQDGIPRTRPMSWATFKRFLTRDTY